MEIITQDDLRLRSRNPNTFLTISFMKKAIGLGSETVRQMCLMHPDRVLFVTDGDRLYLVRSTDMVKAFTVFYQEKHYTINKASLVSFLRNKYPKITGSCKFKIRRSSLAEIDGQPLYEVMLWAKFKTKKQ